MIFPLLWSFFVHTWLIYICVMLGLIICLSFLLRCSIYLRIYWTTTVTFFHIYLFLGSSEKNFTPSLCLHIITVFVEKTLFYHTSNILVLCTRNMSKHFFVSWRKSVNTLKRDVWCDVMWKRFCCFVCITVLVQLSDSFLLDRLMKGFKVKK